MEPVNLEVHLGECDQLCGSMNTGLGTARRMTSGNNLLLVVSC